MYVGKTRFYPKLEIYGDSILWHRMEMNTSISAPLSRPIEPYHICVENGLINLDNISKPNLCLREPVECGFFFHLE